MGKLEERILVTTEQLIKKEEELTTLIKNAEKAFLEAAENVDLLEHYFGGRPVRILKRKFSTQRRAGEDAFLAFKSHVDKLKEIASVYDRAERSNRDFFKTD